jgi:hypothetical protein
MALARRGAVKHGSTLMTNGRRLPRALRFAYESENMCSFTSYDGTLPTPSGNANAVPEIVDDELLRHLGSRIDLSSWTYSGVQGATA